jgi:hypothetical protein
MAVLRQTTHHAQKKTAHAAEQQRPDVAAARAEWVRQQRDLDPEKLVFIDETGATTKMARLHGRAPKGRRCIASVPHGHWLTTTFVAGLRVGGLSAPMLLEGPMDGDAFLAYIERVLIPELVPGEIVVMDMCGRPLRSKRNLQRRVACGSGADMCPAFDATVTCRGPVWEFADRGQSNLARLDSACP